MIKKLLSRTPQPETVLKSDYDALQARYDALAEQQRHVTEERNQVGTLLLDCLALLDKITFGAKQRSLIAARATLVERAKEMGYLPKSEQEQEESKA